MSETKEITSEKNQEVKNTDKQPKEVETYLRIKGEDGATIEMDLMFLRTKGVSQQSLEISFTKWDKVGEQDVEIVHRQSVNSEEDFKAMKKFFSNLTWG